MELFKYNNPNLFLNGEAVKGWDSLRWVERYRDPGEFEIVARLSSGLRTSLPEGSLISHLRTFDIMIVESHQITEEDDTDPLITITGRTLEVVLEERIIGQNWNWAVPPADLNASAYNLVAEYTWAQAEKMINDHIRTGQVIMPGDAIPFILGAYDMGAAVGISEARTIKRGNVLERIKEVLEIEDLGIKVVRRHNFDLPYPDFPTLLLIHAGVDKRNSVVFSTENGDIDAADYLWSIKKLKTSALVTGKFVETMVHGPETGLERRVMLVDASDLDGSLETIPTGGDLTAIRAQMAVRGAQALTAQKQVALSRIDMSDVPTHQYRVDYNIGDIVSIDGSYGPVASMRVVEYAEIEDENGVSAQPTLEFLP